MTSPTATLISHVPSAQGPVGEGDGGGVGDFVGSDAGVPERDPLGRLSAEDPSEESEEHDVRAANMAAATTATAAVDGVLRIMVAMEHRHERDPSRPRRALPGA
ncbi:hypothetical protein ACWD1Y_05695 [Streptomyces sp. NPDC002814]